MLGELRGKAGSHTGLAAATARAETATAELIDWLKAEAPSKTGPSGVGVREYDWYLINVQLLPYTWAEELALMQRELWRARSALAMEEHRNRGLPAPSP